MVNSDANKAMTTSEAAPQAVREFYDEFLVRRMVDYRVHGNIRIDRAVARLSSYLRPTHRVLEIGCGIGMVTERLAALVPQGHVWGCDISPRNIAFARQTVAAQNVTFFECDVLRNLELVKRAVGESIDVVALIDVIEHLPVIHHPELFAALGSLLEARSVIILTYPSPQYQTYLRHEQPHELQIVDEVIELSHVAEVAAIGGFTLLHYSLEDVWLRDQYVHCVLQKSGPFKPVATNHPSVLQRLVGRASRYYRRRQVSRTIERLSAAANSTVEQPGSYTT